MTVGVNAYVWSARQGVPENIQIMGAVLVYGSCLLVSPCVILFAQSLRSPDQRFPKTTATWTALGAFIALAIVVTSAVFVDWVIGPAGVIVRQGPAAVPYALAFYGWMGIVMTFSAQISFHVTRWRNFPHWQLRDVSHLCNFLGSALAVMCLIAFCHDVLMGGKVPGAVNAVFIAIGLITAAIAIIPVSRLAMHCWTLACVLPLHRHLLKAHPTVISVGEGAQGGISGICSRLTIEICDALDLTPVDPSQPLSTSLLNHSPLHGETVPASSLMPASVTDVQTTNELRRLGRQFLREKLSA